MSLELHAHPFSSYCQKVLVAFYENATPFEWRLLESNESRATLAALWPMKKFPVLVDAGRMVVEATTIIEYLHLYHRGPARLLPDDAKAALEVRALDRFFDNYVSTPMQKIVADALRDEDVRDIHGVAEARCMLDDAYAWLERYMDGREWAAGDGFSLADCSAAPALFYADWSHRIPEAFANVHAYRRRLLARPSFARAVDEARRYRSYFPLGAPDRD
ncbi:glutathione S-transferase family protein [Dokdonella sp. MW10]|uniref:glutathione S-transferase family protein n=1 Tax=Dokdonella sp. MW10 TaxID=2992926 RepID=UPI003F7F496B